MPRFFKIENLDIIYIHAYNKMYSFIDEDEII